MYMINIDDLNDPHDPENRTYREINNAEKHTIAIGTLVELEDGVRLWVVHHGRDCDGEPLYELSADKDDLLKEREGFRNRSWVGGYPADSLKKVVQ